MHIFIVCCTVCVLRFATFHSKRKQFWDSLHVKGVLTQKCYMSCFLLQYVVNDLLIEAQNRICSCVQWLTIWRHFYSTQTQFWFQSVLRKAGPRVVHLVNTAGYVSTQNSDAFAMHGVARMWAPRWQLQQRARARSMAANRNSFHRWLLIVYIKTKLMLRGAPFHAQFPSLHFKLYFKCSGPALDVYIS